ncbi:hypothetical protein JCM10213_009331 [Rhodosporidiobolus nylandii]
MELDADRGRRVKYIYLGFLLALLLATITSLALWSSGGRTNTLYLWFAGAGAVGFAVTAFVLVLRWLGEKEHRSALKEQQAVARRGPIATT